MFQSFLLAGFECSSHRTSSGQRMDLIAATGHDTHVAADYARLRAHGIRTVREGLRWHLIEAAPGQYDFASALPMVRAARAAGLQVIWDLCHYGWPDDLDVFAPAFVERFAGLAGAFARLLAEEGDGTAFIAPVNEISFLSWIAGEVGVFHPCAEGQGNRLKAQLVRAAIAAIEATWQILPEARIVHPDPLIHVVAHPERPHEQAAAERLREAQFQAWDMLCGRTAPELGGHPRYLDIIGVNYYPHNQSIFGEGPIDRRHPCYRPFRELLAEAHARYGRPLFIAETSSLGEARPDWLRYVGREVRAARRAGVPVHGICLYPIIHFPDWHDEQRLHQGMWACADEAGEREICRGLAYEMRRQRHLFAPGLHLRTPPPRRGAPDNQPRLASEEIEAAQELVGADEGR